MMRYVFSNYFSKWLCCSLWKCLYHHTSVALFLYFSTKWRHNKLPLLKHEASVEYARMCTSVVRVCLSIYFGKGAGQWESGMYKFSAWLVFYFFVSFSVCFPSLPHRLLILPFSLRRAVLFSGFKQFFFFHLKLRNAHSDHCLVEMLMKHLQALCNIRQMMAQFPCSVDHQACVCCVLFWDHSSLPPISMVN